MKKKMRMGTAQGAPLAKESETSKGGTSFEKNPLIDFLPPEIFDNPLAEIPYYEMQEYSRIPLAPETFAQQWANLQRGKWTDLEDTDGLRYFIPFSKERVPCIVIHDDLYYPAEYQAAIEQKLDVAKEEFPLWYLREYTPIPLKKLDHAQFRNFEGKCDLKIGIIAEDWPGEGIEVWVCETHKEFYLSEEYLPTVKGLIRDLLAPPSLQSPGKNAPWMK